VNEKWGRFFFLNRQKNRNAQSLNGLFQLITSKNRRSHSNREEIEKTG